MNAIDTKIKAINLRKLNLIRLLKGRISNSRKIRLCTQETTILNPIDDSRYVPIKIGNFE